MIEDRSDELRDWYAQDEPDGAELLDQIAGMIRKFCVLPGLPEVVAVVLWIVLTHLLDRFDYAPRLVIRSPEKRSGKTRLMEVVGRLVYSPVRIANCTSAYIYRSINGDPPPTLLLDEADSMFGTKAKAEQNEDVRALINAGFERDTTVGRTVGPHHTPAEFPAFAMWGIAGIGKMPETVEDRAVVVAMKRRTADEQVRPYRLRRDRPDLDDLRELIAAWAGQVREKAGTTYPDLPIDDRAADVWEPLVAVADLAGGDWPQEARAAAVELTSTSAQDDDRSANIRLLNDIEGLFSDRIIGAFVKSADLCQQLRQLTESPWDDYGLTPSKLGRRLADHFRIRTRHSDDRKERGYHQADFMDAFNRYPRCPTPSNPVQKDSEQQEHNEHPRRPKASQGVRVRMAPNSPDTYGTPMRHLPGKRITAAQTA